MLCGAICLRRRRQFITRVSSSHPANLHNKQILRSPWSQTLARQPSEIQTELQLHAGRV